MSDLDSSGGTIKSIAKMVQILECFSALEPSLTPSEISSKTGIPRTTVHRIVATMRELGLLDQAKERERYRLGLRLFQIGSRVLQGMELFRKALPYVQSLLASTAQHVELTVFDGYRAVVVDSTYQARGPNMYPMIFVSTGPAHCTAPGKLLLAYQTTADIQKVIDAGLTRYTDRTNTDAAVLTAELNRIRTQGYGTSYGEFHAEMRAIAAPVRDFTGQVIASLSLFGQIGAVPDDRWAEFIPIVIKHANDLSVQLGYRSES